MNKYGYFVRHFNVSAHKKNSFCNTFLRHERFSGNGIFRLGLFLSFFLSSVFLFSCITRKNTDTEINIGNLVFEPEWIKLAQGIEYARIEYREVPLSVAVLKADLRNENVEIVNTPPHRFGKKSGTVYPETVMRFAKRENTEAALNACFFKYRTPLDYVYEPLGIHIHRGEVLNKPLPKLSALFFTKDRKIIITAKQDAGSIPQGAVYAVSGFNKILENGKIIADGKLRDSRTIAGIDGGGQILFILFAEGENKRRSIGMSIEEAAFFMRKLGVSDAIQLDGGGSSTLIIKRGGKFIRVIPSSIFIPRRTATNFGIINSEKNKTAF